MQRCIDDMALVTEQMPLKTLRNLRQIRTLDDVRALEEFDYDDLVPAQSIYDLFLATAELHGDRPALTVLASAEPTDVDVAWSHQELLEEINRAANLFSSLGVGGDDVVAIVSKTYGAIPAVMWGACTAGVVSCLNHLLSEDVLLELLKLEKAKVLVCPGPDTDPELWSKLNSIIGKVPTLEHILIVGDAIPAGQFQSLKEALESQEHRHLISPRMIGRDTLCAVFHTGGTTGAPKLVPQTHGNVIHAAWCFAQSLGTTEKDSAINGLPFFHVGGTSPWALAIVSTGAHIVILSSDGYRDQNVVKNIWRLVEHFGTTLFGAVPTTISAMQNISVEGINISTLRLVLTGGAGISPSLANRFEQTVGVPLIEQYGMTETVAAISCTPATGARHRGSVGLRHPFTELKTVRDPFVVPMDVCTVGEAGVVVCRGRQVVSGYADAKHNKDSFNDDGWLVTGDVGYMTEDGQLVLTGRKKDLIIRSGHNLDPAAIEEVANIYPDVGSSAAVGMPDSYAGEVPILFVTAKPNHTLDVNSLAYHMKCNIAEPPARPRHIYILPNLPLTGVGKVFKPALRWMAITKKIQMELARADSELIVESMTEESDGTVVATVNDAAVSGDSDAIRTQVERALGDLLVKVDLNWLTE